MIEILYKYKYLGTMTPVATGFALALKEGEIQDTSQGASISGKNYRLFFNFQTYK
jgi:hypothetical protein